MRLALGATAVAALTVLDPAMADHPWRLAMIIVIAFGVAVAADWLAERLLSWWDRRLEGS